jgi:hypothetical protein
MEPKEKKEQLVNKIHILKEKIKIVDFMKRLELKDLILELRNKLEPLKLRTNRKIVKSAIINTTRELPPVVL